MADYFEGKKYSGIRYPHDGVNFMEFEDCTFERCDFGACTFLAVTFIDCTFTDCNFVGTQINYVALRTVHFIGCDFTEINFAMVDKLIFDVAFTNCILDFAKFYTLKLKDTAFTNCSMVAVDFMSTDLTGSEFPTCNLHRTVFDKTIANKVDFSTATHYSLDPGNNKIKRAIFSKSGLRGLLDRHQLQID